MQILLIALMLISLLLIGFGLKTSLKTQKLVHEYKQSTKQHPSQNT
jgi:hypothetical protein